MKPWLFLPTSCLSPGDTWAELWFVPGNTVPPPCCGAQISGTWQGLGTNGAEKNLGPMELRRIWASQTHFSKQLHFENGGQWIGIMGWGVILPCQQMCLVSPDQVSLPLECSFSTIPIQLPAASVISITVLISFSSAWLNKECKGVFVLVHAFRGFYLWLAPRQEHHEESCLPHSSQETMGKSPRGRSQGPGTVPMTYSWLYLLSPSSPNNACQVLTQQWINPLMKWEPPWSSHLSIGPAAGIQVFSMHLRAYFQFKP